MNAKLFVVYTMLFCQESSPSCRFSFHIFRLFTRFLTHCVQLRFTFPWGQGMHLRIPFHLAVRTWVACRAGVFHLAVGAGVAVHAVVFPLTVQALNSFPHYYSHAISSSRTPRVQYPPRAARVEVCVAPRTCRFVSHSLEFFSFEVGTSDVSSKNKCDRLSARLRPLCHSTMRAVIPRSVIAQAGYAQSSALLSSRKARSVISGGYRQTVSRASAIGKNDLDNREVLNVETSNASADASSLTSPQAIANTAVASALAAVMSLEPLSMVGSQTVGLGVATGLTGMTTSLLTPEPADAALSNPNTRLPRNGVSALRRAVPAINEDTGMIQSKLEEAAYLLRIPQRKPWGTMGDNIKVSLATVRDKREKILAPVPTGSASDEAESTRAELEQLLLELVDIAGSQDTERFDRGVAMALDATSRLKVYQAPGLPFDVPRKYDTLPRLTGRATVDLTIRKAPGTSFGYVNGDETNTVTLTVVADGYNAPLTAGNFIENVKKGVYDGLTFKKSETALLAPPTKSNARINPSDTLPLEVKPIDDYEPRYRSPLNVMGAEELPTLPLSVNGSLAMARGTEDGTSSASQFFIYSFDKRSAGLGGMAFEEGEFSVFGYVVKGEEEGFLGQLGTGDTIVRAKGVSGGEKLVNGLPEDDSSAAETETTEQ